MAQRRPDPDPKKPYLLRLGGGGLDATGTLDGGSVVGGADIVVPA